MLYPVTSASIVTRSRTKDVVEHMSQLPHVMVTVVSLIYLQVAHTNAHLAFDTWKSTAFLHCV